MVTQLTDADLAHAGTVSRVRQAVEARSDLGVETSIGIESAKRFASEIEQSHHLALVGTVLQ